MEDMEEFSIAVKRQERSHIKIGDALERISDIGGVKMVGTSRAGVAQILATTASIAIVKDRLARLCHIEPRIEHRPQ
jgi:hypothetical protein